MSTIKTLADLKRFLVPGMLLDLEHLQTGWRPGTRPIHSINSVGFTLTTIKPDGTITQSHSNWPKASYFEPTNDGFIFYSDWYVEGKEVERVPLLKYTFC